jgi:hypothetical protein
LARDLVCVRADIEGEHSLARQSAADRVDRGVRREGFGSGTQRGVKAPAVLRQHRSTP